MSGHSIFYGDIHNHNAHGYGVGSIERSLDIARTHLDFFAFTGHSSWHDMPSMEGQRERHWIDGFKRLKDTWPRVQQVIAEGNRDGEDKSIRDSRVRHRLSGETQRDPRAGSRRTYVDRTER